MSDREELTEKFREKVKVMIATLARWEVHTAIAIENAKVSLENIRKSKK